MYFCWRALVTSGQWSVCGQLFIIRVERDWHSEVVEAPSLETSKVSLDEALSTDGAVASLFISGELGYMVFRGPFQLLRILFFYSKER